MKEIAAFPVCKYHTVHRNKHGELISEDWHENIVPDEALSYVIRLLLTGASKQANWYVILIDDASPAPAAGWTYANGGNPSAGTWTEFINYDEAARPTYTDGSGLPDESGQQAANTGAVFTISTGGGTVQGAGLVTTVSTKGDKTAVQYTNVLYSASDFTGGVKNVDPGDTLTITITISAQDA
jgi:hypothetical protein